MSLRLQRRGKLQSPEWYKQSFGTWPYSFDIMDILRGVIPEALLGGAAGAVSKKNPAIVGGLVGAASAAIARSQILAEITFYPEEYVELPPEVVTHNVFLILFQSVLAGLAGAGLSMLATRL
jgi:hypothetical protein